jgi:hypothetical protein
MAGNGLTVTLVVAVTVHTPLITVKVYTPELFEEEDDITGFCNAEE